MIDILLECFNGFVQMEQCSPHLKLEQPMKHTPVLFWTSEPDMGSSSFTAILSLQANGFTVCDEMDMQVSKATLLSAKSDSDFMFCLQSYQGLRIDKSLVY